jgi:hypothetical protein
LRGDAWLTSTALDRLAHGFEVLDQESQWISLVDGE